MKISHIDGTCCKDSSRNSETIACDSVVNLLQRVSARSGPQAATWVLYDGHFYAPFGTNSRRDGLVCMGVDGQIMRRAALSKAPVPSAFLKTARTTL